MKKIMQLNLLTLSVLCAQQVHALELIADQHLSDVSGQDGIVITHEMSKATINQVNWYDPDLVGGTQQGLGLHNCSIPCQHPPLYFWFIAIFLKNLALPRPNLSHLENRFYSPL